MEIYIKLLLDTCFVCNDCSQLELAMKLTLIAVPYKTNIQWINFADLSRSNYE